MVEMTDWERDNGVPLGVIPIGRSYISRHHYRQDGSRIVGPYGPWRRRDKVARVFRFHCFECLLAWRSDG